MPDPSHPERLYRVTGSASYHLPTSASDDEAAQAMRDLRRWQREHKNDAELGRAYDAPTEDGDDRGESVRFFLHLNDVSAATLAAAATRGLLTLETRLRALGRDPLDAYSLDIDATRQARRTEEY